MRKTPLATLIAGALLAMDASALDLLQAFTDAQAYDSQFASARAQRDAGYEREVQARAGLMPQVTFSGSANQVNGTSTQSSTSNPINYNSQSYQVSLQQPLYRPSNLHAYEQGKLATAVADIQFEQARIDLALRVAQAYFDVLAAEDVIAFIDAQKVAIGEQLESAKRNFEVGTATITDAHEAQARYDLALAQEIAAKNDLEVKRNAFAVITGKQPATLSGLRQGVTISVPQPASIDQWVASAETGNVSVVAQSYQMEIAKLDVERNKAGHRPTLDAVASYAHNSGLAYAPKATVETTSIGLQLTLPIFSGFSTTSQVRQAISLEEKARTDLDTAKRNAAQGARTAYLGVQSGLSQVRALEAAETSSKLALEANQLGYQVGVRINIDVLNAQQQLYSTRRDLAKARYDTLVSGLRLKAAAGSLSQEDLSQLNALLTSR